MKSLDLELDKELSRTVDLISKQLANKRGKWVDDVAFELASLGHVVSIENVKLAIKYLLDAKLVIREIIDDGYNEGHKYRLLTPEELVRNKNAG